MNKMKGFTLIEIMIVVVVLGILAAIAYPNYQDYVLRSHRAAATGCLVEISQFMERNRTTTLRYDQDEAAGAINNARIQQLACTDDLRYAVSFAEGPAQRSYTLQAVPTGPQVNDSCGTLKLNQAGVRTPAVDCW